MAFPGKTDTFRKAYRQLTADETADVEAVKVAAETIEAILLKRQKRESSVAQTHLEDCVMWAVKGISG